MNLFHALQQWSMMFSSDVQHQTRALGKIGTDRAKYIDRFRPLGIPKLSQLQSRLV
jgi:hypothetical protein